MWSHGPATLCYCQSIFICLHPTAISADICFIVPRASAVISTNYIANICIHLSSSAVICTHRATINLPRSVPRHQYETNSSHPRWRDPNHRAVADLGGRRGRAPPPPGGPNSFNFMQFLGKFDKFVCWCPGELAPPPRGNRGSATAGNKKSGMFILYNKTAFQ